MTWHPHVTVATVVECDGRFLLVREWAENQIRINQPAGHLEADELLQEAAIRETLEETAWQVSLTGVIGTCVYKAPSNGETYVRTTFIAEALHHSPEQPLDDGIIEAVWLTREQIVEHKDQLRSPMVLQVIDDYLAGHRYPLDVIK